MDAEVLGIGCDGRPVLTKAQDDQWHRELTPQQYDAVAAEAFDWEREGVRDFWRAGYGGVVNKPTDALAYAKALLGMTSKGRAVAHGLLTAVERDDVWHIRRPPDPADMLSFSRTTGKLLSPLP